MTPLKDSVLLTGATGYVGGRLLHALESQGVRVRCLARRPEQLEPRVARHTEVVGGDVFKPESLEQAMTGIKTAYYLIHSMGSSGDFEDQDRVAAHNFGRAARACGVERIVYLGGLGHGSNLSKHLKSRHEVGDMLRASGVPVIEFRASIIIGSGSLSFELIRALVEKLPVMVTPRWVRIKAQPISIEDVITYLVAANDSAFAENHIFEIGGPDKVSYREIMQEYGRQRGLRRLMIPVPVLTPRLSSLWLGLVTPVYARIGRKLVESLPNETLVRDDAASHAFSIEPRGLRDAIARALVNEDEAFARTRWSDALSSGGSGPRSWGGERFGSRVFDSRAVTLPVSPELAFEPIRQIGGKRGWYFGDWIWRLRAFVDLMVGGVGVRRGRRNPEEVARGDALDFWRVEEYEPNHLLRLRAEMRLPGRAWLQFEVTPVGGDTEIRQTAIFDPAGLFGLLYWYALYPIHVIVFRGMLRGISRRAIRRGREVTSSAASHADELERPA